MSVVDFAAHRAPEAAKYAADKARVGIVVDASCDVPDAFLRSPDVAVIPIPIHIGSRVYVDQHDPEATRQYLRENSKGEGAHGQSVPMDAAALKNFFVERFALDYDSMYCLTITQSRSPIYEAASDASMQALSAIRSQREASGISRPFQMRVIDTKQMFAGSGIPALACRDLVNAGHDAHSIRDNLYQVIANTYAYAVPDDLAYTRARGKARGERSIGLLSALLGGALDIKPIVQVRQGETSPVAKCRGRDEAWSKLLRFTGERVHAGLLVPHVLISYGGPVDDLIHHREFVALQGICDAQNVQLHAVTMSITGMMNMGSGGLFVGFACDEHTARF